MHWNLKFSDKLLAFLERSARCAAELRMIVCLHRSMVEYQKRQTFFESRQGRSVLFIGSSYDESSATSLQWVLVELKQGLLQT